MTFSPTTAGVALFLLLPLAASPQDAPSPKTAKKTGAKKAGSKKAAASAEDAAVATPPK